MGLRFEVLYTFFQQRAHFQERLWWSLRSSVVSTHLDTKVTASATSYKLKILSDLCIGLAWLCSVYHILQIWLLSRILNKINAHDIISSAIFVLLVPSTWISNKLNIHHTCSTGLHTMLTQVGNMLVFMLGARCIWERHHAPNSKWVHNREKTHFMLAIWLYICPILLTKLYEGTQTYWRVCNIYIYTYIHINFDIVQYDVIYCRGPETWLYCVIIVNDHLHLPYFTDEVIRGNTEI